MNSEVVSEVLVAIVPLSRGAVDAAEKIQSWLLSFYALGIAAAFPKWTTGTTFAFQFARSSRSWSSRAPSPR